MRTNSVSPAFDATGLLLNLAVGFSMTMKQQTPENTNSSTQAIIVGRRAESRSDYAHIKKLFIEWLATPLELRRPPTQARFAAAHGVHATTVSEWACDEEVQEMQIKLVCRHGLSRFREVMDGLVEAAIAGNAASQKLYLQYVIGWTEKFEHRFKSKEFEVSFGDLPFQPKANGKTETVLN